MVTAEEARNLIYSIFADTLLKRVQLEHEESVLGKLIHRKTVQGLIMHAEMRLVYFRLSPDKLLRAYEQLDKINPAQPLNVVREDINDVLNCFRAQKGH
jgi:hypothetical protein